MIKISDTVCELINMASFVSDCFGHSYIGKEHLLLVLVGERKFRGIITEQMNEKDIADYATIKNYIAVEFGTGEKNVTGRKKFSSDLVKVLSKASMIASLKKEKEIEVSHVIESMLLQDEVKNMLITVNNNKDNYIGNVCDNRFEYDISYISKISKETPILNSFSKDITLSALNDDLDPVLERENEINSVINILLRKNKNNPCLLGYPGVGKSAVVDGLATNIVKGLVPSALRNKRIVSLDLSSLLAGARYRGDFEERIKNIIAEVKKAKNVILFIDEIHNIVKLGSGEGILDAANILKPELARGEVSIIGATTVDEYMETIERDDALARRFRKVMVDEPDEECSKRILKGIKAKYEKYHDIKIDDEALDIAVERSVKLIIGKYLPDKAIDIIDETASMIRIENKKILNGYDIDRYLDREYGSKIINTAEVKSNIKNEVYGQNNAVDRIIDSIDFNNSGRMKNSKPLSFALCGPKGCGKTFLAESVGKYLFGKDVLLKFNMSEFVEKQSVSKLIGSPPGYVGYDDGGLLFKEISKNPARVIVFDGIENAHSDVLSVIASMMEEGVLRYRGRSVSLKDSVIILTENGRALSNNAPGFLSEESRVERNSEQLGIYSVVSDIITMEKVNVIAAEMIYNRAISELIETTLAFGYRLSVANSVKEVVLNRSLLSTFGYKNIKRTFDKEVGEKVKQALLNKNEDMQDILVDVVDKKITIFYNFMQISLENNRLSMYNTKDKND